MKKFKVNYQWHLCNTAPNNLKYGDEIVEAGDKDEAIELYRQYIIDNLQSNQTFDCFEDDDTICVYTDTDLCDNGGKQYFYNFQAVEIEG